MVCVVGRMRDLILQLSKSSIYSTKPTHALEVVICLVQNAVLEILQKKKQCVDGLMIMCAAIADTTTLKTHLESVVKTILSKLIKNAKATKKANLFIHI